MKIKLGGFLFLLYNTTFNFNKVGHLVFFLVSIWLQFFKKLMQFGSFH